MDIVNVDINNNFKMCIPGLSNTEEVSYGKNVQDSIRNNKIWSKEETSLLELLAVLSQVRDIRDLNIWLNLAEEKALLEQV